MNHDHNPETLTCRRCGNPSDFFGSYLQDPCLCPKCHLGDIDQRQPLPAQRQPVSGVLLQSGLHQEPLSNDPLWTVG